MTAKIIVLDDDPTGSQTVHSCLLLMRWDVETLRLGLQDASPLMFVLTNTRAMTPEGAASTTQTVCQNLKLALAAEQISDYLIVSRSDSTLRGHYPVETDVIAAELGPMDAHFLVPAFFEGGRITVDSIHYLNGIPVHETEFARDSVFGYSHSYLPDYVEEKTKGRIPAASVERFLLPAIREGCLERLVTLQENRCCAVDGEIQSDLDRFAVDILAAVAQGKRFLFRSAASWLTALAHLPPQPIPPEAMATYVRGGRPGCVIVGSHVQKTTTQLENLLKAPGIVAVEINVRRLLLPDRHNMLLQETLEQVHDAYEAGNTPVVFTSREEIEFETVATRLSFGEEVSALLMDVIRGLPDEIGFLISKGGITSNDTLSKGLELTAARLLGQVIAGVSMVRTPADHPYLPDLPVVLFPGNVGDEQALTTVYQRLSRSHASPVPAL